MTSTFSVPAAGTAVDGSAKDLTGKVALVIGGTAHMGLDFARNFASRGASVSPPTGTTRRRPQWPPPGWTRPPSRACGPR